MILGNFMQLSEIDPNDVFRWFMEMFIDAYDWVMVPNVYGMSQYADGGLMSSKPYISSSNYIKKMSNFQHEYWCEIWDALFWSFICKHQKVFKKNPRMSLMVNQLKKKQKEEILAFLKITKKFFNQQKI
jgi:deoxyribodipyrimidine photolyase-related protein